MSRKVTKLWRCKDGTRIRICDMTDSHLAKAIALLERFAKAKHFHTVMVTAAFADTLHGDMAILAAEEAEDELLEDGPDVFLPEIHDSLVAEQSRRAEATKED